MSKRTNRHAEEWADLLIGRYRLANLLDDRTSKIIYDSARLAFAAYAEDWGRTARWNWPFDHLYNNGSFDGVEPWTVLLRHAVHVAKLEAYCKGLQPTAASGPRAPICACYDPREPYCPVHPSTKD